MQATSHDHRRHLATAIAPSPRSGPRDRWSSYAIATIMGALLTAAIVIAAVVAASLGLGADVYQPVGGPDRPPPPVFDRVA